MNNSEIMTEEQYLEFKEKLLSSVNNNEIGAIELAIVRFIDANYKPDMPIKEKLKEMGLTELQVHALLKLRQLDINEDVLDTLDVVEPSDYEDRPLPEISWTIKGILPEGVSLLAAPPKFHKSFFAMQMAVSICSGTDFFGYETVKGDCIYFDLESNATRPLSRLRAMYSTTDIRGLHIVTGQSNVPRLGEGFEEALENLLLRYPNTRLVIVDVLQLISPSNGRDFSYASDYNTIGMLNEIANNLRISILAVHHTRKLRDDNDAVNNISGSCGITGAVTTIFMLSKDKRNDKKATLLITGNDIETIEWCMHFDDNQLRWCCDGDVAELEMKAFLNHPEVKTVFHLMKDCNEWSGSATDLSEAARGLGYDITPEDFGRYINGSNAYFLKTGLCVSKIRRNDARVIKIWHQVS